MLETIQLLLFKSGMLPLQALGIVLVFILYLRLFYMALYVKTDIGARFIMHGFGIGGAVLMAAALVYVIHSALYEDMSATDPSAVIAAVDDAQSATDCDAALAAFEDDITRYQRVRPYAVKSLERALKECRQAYWQAKESRELEEKLRQLSPVSPAEPTAP